ncbi:exported hypothetical protein [Hyphomicrobiales bacterium]|nr:exported hypothetical protein [Hyphomicrobiales bacterium]CAH1691595.1 conserved exported hypothetical protein [Hyphomicrobiales bacterium]
MFTDKLTVVLSAAALCLLLSNPNSAHANAEFRSAWADPAQTRTLEELLYQAIQGKGVGVLTSAHSEIVAKDLAAINHIQRLIEKGDTQAIQRISMNMNACHHAGVTIRLMVLGAYETAEPGSQREIAISSEDAQRFAEYMDRCERMSKMSGNRRLIGTP